jgi:hypothetical protein
LVGSVTDGSLIIRGDQGLVIGNGGFERMRVTSTGNVGIGTTDPQDTLHVSTGTTTETNHLFGMSTGSIAISASPIVKAWANFDGSPYNANTYRKAYNVSSIVGQSTGKYRINFTTSMDSWDYAVTLGSNRLGSSTPTDANTIDFYNNDADGLNIACGNSNGFVNHEQVCFAVFQH